MDASQADVDTLIQGITSDSDSTRKLSVFHLQSLLTDPSFAEAFLEQDGLPVLRRIVLEESGNTLAYALGGLTNTLDLGLGWDQGGAGREVVRRAVELVVSRPVINVLRNALSLLVLIVSRPLEEKKLGHTTSTTRTTSPDPTSRTVYDAVGSSEGGFRALKPLLKQHTDFLSCLIERLGSADHALCGNALKLMNALLRDAILNGEQGEDWSGFVRRLQELGVLDQVEYLMRGEAAGDLAGPLLEFENLMKVLLRRWRATRVDFRRSEHRLALERIQTATSSFILPQRPGSAGDETTQQGTDEEDDEENDEEESQGRSRRALAQLGFTNGPKQAFAETGYLGLVDLEEFVRDNPDAFQKALLEQEILPAEQQCPIGRASLTVTRALYEHFDVAGADAKKRAGRRLKHEDGLSIDKNVAQPLVLRWRMIHAATFTAFLRLWGEAGALVEEFGKIEDLIHVLIMRVIGEADRRRSTEQVVGRLANEPLATVRQWQLHGLQQVHDQAWGADLRRLREELHNEAVHFMQEQRIRCLLQGAWFPCLEQSDDEAINGTRAHTQAWRFVQLSPSRRYLHHARLAQKLDKGPQFAQLQHKIDINSITSVVSSVTTADPNTGLEAPSGAAADRSVGQQATILSIKGVHRGAMTEDESVLLQLHANSSTLASEWLDGLLMLLNQKPITADTNKLINVIEDWSLKVRLLNLQWEDIDWDKATSGSELPVPSREGLDTEYWYDMGDG